MKIFPETKQMVIVPIIESENEWSGHFIKKMHLPQIYYLITLLLSKNEKYYVRSLVPSATYYCRDKNTHWFKALILVQNTNSLYTVFFWSKNKSASGNKMKILLVTAVVSVVAVTTAGWYLCWLSWLLFLPCALFAW